MAKEETIGFVGLRLDDPASLDGPACRVCGMIMVRRHKEHCGEEAFRKRKEPLGVYVEMPCDCGHPWICTSCGATTECTEVKGGEK